MTRKEILRAVAFLLIMCTVLLVLCDLFEHENSLLSRRYETFYDLEKNTVDGIIVGTSGIDRYWMSSKAYEDYGMTVYPLSTDSQPAWLITEIIDEALKYQNPEFIIIDFRQFTATHSGTDGVYQEIYARRVIDGMKFFSINRLKSIFKTKKVMDKILPEGESALDYYFSFIKYHTRWEEDNFSFDELKHPKSPYMGFYVNEYYSIVTLDKFPESVKTDERLPLDPICDDALNEVLEYVKDKDFEVIFLNTPHHLTELEAGRTNTICDRLDEAGVDYACYYMEDNMINVNRDYYDDGHVNYYGARTFTDKFAAFLDEKYDLPDHRNDENVSKDWNGTYDEILKKINLLEYVKPVGKTPIFSSLHNPNGVTVSWYPVDNSEGYYVYRNTEAGGRFTKIATITERGTTEFLDTDVEEGQTYYYMVRPFSNSKGNGLYSTTIEVTVKR